MATTFGEKLRQLRLSRNLSLRDLEERSGLSYSFIGSLEKGRFNPSRDSIEKLASALGEEPDELMILAGFLPNPDSSIVDVFAGTAKADVERLVKPETKTPPDDDPVPPEQAEFLKWVEENLESSFFYDFSKSPDEQKKEMMKSLRIVWELEKHRKPGQKQGE